MSKNKTVALALFRASLVFAQSGTISVKTANYTITSGDNGKEFVFNGSSLTATLPSAVGSISLSRI